MFVNTPKTNSLPNRLSNKHHRKAKPWISRWIKIRPIRMQMLLLNPLVSNKVKRQVKKVFSPLKATLQPRPATPPNSLNV